MELSETDDAWLRDLRAASMRCLALLSTAEALKLRLVDAGALPLLCTAGGLLTLEGFTSGSALWVENGFCWSIWLSRTRCAQNGPDRQLSVHDTTWCLTTTN